MSDDHKNIFSEFGSVGGVRFINQDDKESVINDEEKVIANAEELSPAIVSHYEEKLGIIPSRGGYVPVEVKSDPNQLPDPSPLSTPRFEWVDDLEQWKKDNNYVENQ